MEFIPEGRGAVDKALYLVMRRVYRDHKRMIEEQTRKSIIDLMKNGIAYMKWEWREYGGLRRKQQRKRAAVE